MKLPRVMLGLQGAVVLMSLLGYGIFSKYPELLQRFDPDASFYLWAFQGFAVINVVLGGLAVLGESLGAHGIRIMLPFAAVFGVSLLSELGGTTFGIPFGAYSYTDLLGPKIFDKVPYVIPLSWFTMAWPAWVLARRHTNGMTAILFGAALLVAWDLVLDPAMSGATSYWVWGEPGSYYGMPWLNLVGWGVTGVVLLGLLAAAVPHPRSSPRFALEAYVINLSLPIGLSLLNGFWIAALAGAATGAVALLIVRREATPGSPAGNMEVSHGRI